MKILAFAGSNSSKSINKELVSHTTSYFKDETIELLDLNDFEMPLFSIDRLMQNGMHPLAVDFAQKIDESDLLIISLAEHNGSYSTAFKNIYDWISRIKDRKAFGDKPLLLMATSPGARGGATVLEMAKNSMPFFGGNVLETYSLPKFHENFDSTKGVINGELKVELESKIGAVKIHIQKEQFIG